MYNHQDHLGSTHVVTDKDVYLTQVLDYYPFGDARIEQQYGGTTQNIQYVGTRHDAETDLNLMGARYADTRRGQFISQDPVFWEIGQTKDGKLALLNPQAQNSYSYAFNNPITQKDPTGRCPWCVAIAGVAMYAPQITSYLSALASPLGQFAVGQAVDDVQNGDYGWAAFGIVTAGEGSAAKNLTKADNMLLNAFNGARREAQFGKSLADQFGSGAVQRQVYLRNADGTIARDSFGSARRLDFAVIKDGKVQGLYEVTSPTANKNAQELKELNIRNNGGTYIRDRQTGNLLDVSKKPTKRVDVN